jgi:hypothetical protein
MRQYIVYQNQDDGRLAVIIPAHESGLTMEQIALKDVPHNVPYKVVDVSVFPTDWRFFDAWEIEMSNPDGVGADYGAGTKRHVAGWNLDGTPIIWEQK